MRKPSVMSLVRRGTALAALVLGAAPLAAQQPTPTPAPPAAPAAAHVPTHAEAIALGRATFLAAFTGAIDSLMATADPASMRDDLRSRLTDGIAQISLQLGAERRMISERVVHVEGRYEYQRTSEFEMVPVPLVFRVILGAPGKWRGFTAAPEEATPVGEELKP
ncbi:MAG: hypothetical protein KF689_05560 [Gemmatimonadaceae bacterium]|nr:hypothetical protein [Gemmatimonadaceae bacterium]MCW5825360.1 hypothetical protein [Gemmatimonadaceae bacterium]